MLQLIIMMFLILINILISIAFITLMERKILSNIQIRKGPNKLIMKGVSQPFADALKLFFKENLYNYNSNLILFNLAPMMMFILMLTLWQMYINMKYEMIMQSMLIFIIISGLNVYYLFIMGWSSNSKYSLLGSYRNIAQTVSYEVSMIFLIIILVIKSSNSFNLIKLNEFNKMNMMYMFMMLNLFLIWKTIMLSELNRSPFDLAESESELVSGFNTEYSGSKFIFMFLAEYGMIIFISYLTSILFMNQTFMMYLMLNLMLIITIRGTYPRYRYDNLMNLNWKIFLPFILMLLTMYFYM